MHMGNNSPNYTHTMMDSKLAAITQKQIFGNSSLVFITGQRRKSNARELPESKQETSYKTFIFVAE